MSPVIILGLVLMWAVVLIPMWLRRHDEAEETRSVDRFSAAMHTLSRREAKVPDDRYVVVPHRSRSLEVHVSGASAPRAPHSTRRTAADRRRRTLLVLGAAAVLFLGMAALTGNAIAWVFEVMLDLALAAFVVHLRRMATIASVSRRRASVAARRVVADAPAAPRRAGTTAQRQQQRRWEYAQSDVGDRDEQVTVRYADSRPAEPDDHVAQGVEEDYGSDAFDDATAVFDQTAFADTDAPAEAIEPVVASGGFFDQDAVLAPKPAMVEPAAPERLASEPAPAATAAAPSYAGYSGPGFIAAGVVPGRRDGEPETVEPAAKAPIDPPAVSTTPWEPVPVPPPIYTTKPAAPPRRPRYEPDEPLLPPLEPTADLSADELEEILDRRWAVND